MTPVWWLLAFIPALIALYFLKLKRQEVIFSSTYLWKRSMEDLHVNAPFQRLRKSILFLLQLIALCLLIFAVWRPRCDQDVEAGRNIIVVIDQSASMNAIEKGRPRFEFAREQALALVEALRPGDRMQILSFASKTTTVQPLSPDRGLLAAKLRALEPTSMSTDLAQALLVANAMASTLQAVEVHVIGDGCYGKIEDLPPEVARLNMKFVNTGTKIPNIAITEADVRRSFGVEKAMDVFALVENFTDDDRVISVELYRGDQLERANELTLAAGENQPVVFDVSDIEFEEGESRVLRMQIQGDGSFEDGLPDDNAAVVKIPGPKAISILFVGKQNVFVETALTLVPNATTKRMSLEEYETFVTQRETGLAEEEDDVPEATWDVVVFDREAPTRPPEEPSLFVGAKPPLPEGVPEPSMVDRPQFMDMDQSHPVNRFMSFSNINILKSLVFPLSKTNVALVEAEEGAIITAFTYREEGKYPARAVVIGFDVTQSNWPINHHSFPIFFTNAISWLGVGEEAGTLRWKTGESLSFAVDRASQLGAPKIYDFLAPEPGTLPGEAPTRRESATPGRNGLVTFGTARSIGVYELHEEGERIAEFPVSLLSTTESNLEPQEEIDLGDIQVEADTRLEAESSDLWRWFALGALAFLLLEWYVYNRRVYV